MIADYEKTSRTHWAGAMLLLTALGLRRPDQRLRRQSRLHLRRAGEPEVNHPVSDPAYDGISSFDL